MLYLIFDRSVMSDLEKLKNSINPHKQTSREFFLGLLDADGQKAYEDEHLSAVMALLKIIRLNRLRAKADAAKKERKALNSSSEKNAESYRRVLELDALISSLNEKINSYKPFFDEPYFARMDLYDAREGYNSYYIGKRGDEGLEIVDWRAPLARKYYQKSRTSFTINDYDYKLILRRALRTEKGKVLDIKNEYLNLKDYLTVDEIGGRDDSVIFDPFLKEILLSRKEKREITDIIETIQEKQYEIITLPERDRFIVQGVAGSGKTMIMLHRLSYILYNNEKLKPSDVLVITPSDSFNDFIDELSAILELEKVKTYTLNGYFLKLLKNAGVDVADKIDYCQPVPQELLNYVYSEKFTADIKSRLLKIYDGVFGLFASSECAQFSENLAAACEMQEKQYTFIKNTGLRVRRCILGEIKEKPDGGLYYTKQFRNMFNCVQDVKEFLQLLSDGRMGNYAFFYRQLLSFYKSLKFLRRYSQKICLAAVDDLNALSETVDKEISDLRRYKRRIGETEVLTYPDRIEKREQLKKETEDAIRAVQRIADGFLPVYDFADVVRADGFLSGIGKCENVYGVVRFFYRETVKKIKTRFGMSTSKLCRFDPFALCLLAAELGFSLSPQFGFVFVDEAQDISPAEYAVLRTVNGRAAFNIFGDLKQNMTPYRGIKSWEEIGYKVYNLNLNYRNTNQIVEYVSGNLGIDMRAIGADGSEVEIIDERSATKYLSDKNGLRAVITSESGYGKYLRKSYNSVRDTGRISKSKINILTVYESKGLEFTAVAVADSDMSDNEKYIAYTRALKYLARIT